MDLNDSLAVVEHTLGRVFREHLEDQITEFIKEMVAQVGQGGARTRPSTGQYGGAGAPNPALSAAMQGALGNLGQQPVPPTPQGAAPFQPGATAFEQMVAGLGQPTPTPQAQVADPPAAPDVPATPLTLDEKITAWVAQYGTAEEREKSGKSLDYQHTKIYLALFKEATETSDTAAQERIAKECAGLDPMILATMV